MTEIHLPTDYNSFLDSSGGTRKERESCPIEDPFAIPYFFACQGQDCDICEGRESRDPCSSVRHPIEYDL